MKKTLGIVAGFIVGYLVAAIISTIYAFAFFSFLKMGAPKFIMFFVGGPTGVLLIFGVWYIVGKEVYLSIFTDKKTNK